MTSIYQEEPVPPPFVSTFGHWLDWIDGCTAHLNLATALKAVAFSIDCAFGTRLRFARHDDGQWQIVAGAGPHEAGTAEETVKLDHGMAILVDTWGAVGRQEQATLYIFVNRLIALNRYRAN